MKNICFYFLFLFLNIAYSKINCLRDNYFVSMPDKDTYANLNILSFSEKEITVRNYLNSNIKIHKYKIINDNELIVNDTISWGNLICKKDSFELFDDDGFKIQYTKLKATRITCSENELKEIINSSSWDFDFGVEKGKIYITDKNVTDRSKFKYKIIKLMDTYLLILDNTWNFTISTISKNTIEFYGLARTNNVPDKVVMSRVYK